jgi:NAD-specific glutamate dehydrogenase
VIYLIDINHLEETPKYNARAIEKKLEDVGRLWAEFLRDAFEVHHTVKAQHRPDRSQIRQRFSRGSYQEEYEAKQAVHDIRKVEEVLKTGRLRGGNVQTPRLP